MSTKQELQAENERLRAENAGMRELLAAISAVAGTVPVSKDNDYIGEWKRSCQVLANIKGLAALGDWSGFLAYAATELRRIAAEPVGYEVYVDSFGEPAAEPELTVRERAQRGARKAAAREQAGEGEPEDAAAQDEDEANDPFIERPTGLCGHPVDAGTQGVSLCRGCQDDDADARVSA